MRLGTDAVLLGAWSDVIPSAQILDVGTGCGILALMAAQRTPGCSLLAVDVDPESVLEARFNFEKSPWAGRLSARQIPVQELAKLPEYQGYFDHLISNPPFFNQSTPSPVRTRHLARHSDALTLSELFGAAEKLLSTNGKISLIIPFDALESCLFIARGVNFHPLRITTVYPYPSKKAERVLMEFSRPDSKPIFEEMYIRAAKNEGFSETYLRLTSDFYL